MLVKKKNSLLINRPLLLKFKILHFLEQKLYF